MDRLPPATKRLAPILEDRHAKRPRRTEPEQPARADIARADAEAAPDAAPDAQTSRVVLHAEGAPSAWPDSPPSVFPHFSVFNAVDPAASRRLMLPRMQQLDAAPLLPSLNPDGRWRALPRLPELGVALPQPQPHFDTAAAHYPSVAGARPAVGADAGSAAAVGPQVRRIATRASTRAARASASASASATLNLLGQRVPVEAFQARRGAGGRASPLEIGDDWLRLGDHRLDVAPETDRALRLLDAQVMVSWHVLGSTRTQADWVIADARRALHDVLPGCDAYDIIETRTGGAGMYRLDKEALQAALQTACAAGTGVQRPPGDAGKRPGMERTPQAAARIPAGPDGPTAQVEHPERVQIGSLVVGTNTLELAHGRVLPVSDMTCRQIKTLLASSPGQGVPWRSIATDMHGAQRCIAVIRAELTVLLGLDPGECSQRILRYAAGHYVIRRAQLEAACQDALARADQGLGGRDRNFVDPPHQPPAAAVVEEARRHDDLT